MATGRSKPEERRDRQFNVALTADELLRLHAAARASGMRPVDFGRARLLDTARTARTTRVVRQLDPLLLVQLSRVGNNLNQIARGLHQFAVPTPELLSPVLSELRDLLRQAEQA
jgi:hypothetical protein